MERLSRRTTIRIAVALLVLAGVLLAAVWGRGLTATAKSGKQHAIAAAHELRAMDATAAAGEFEAAGSDFDALVRAFGPEWVARSVGAVPWVGRQYVTARELALIGADGSAAGLGLAKAAMGSAEASAVASGAAAAGGSAETSAAAGSRMNESLRAVVDALAAFSAVAQRADALSTDGLVPPLARQVTALQTTLAQAMPLGERSRALVALASYLLSGEHRFIVVSQDGAELRPTGGWAGSYGIVTTGESGVKLESYQDVFTLPNPPGRVPMPEGALQTNDFNFRNANWWLDFPTSAQRMLAFWDEYKMPPVDGIVVIDTVLMADLLDVVGPVTVADFNETFTDKNLLDRLLYHTQVLRGGQTDRKDVLVQLAEQLERRVLEAPPAELAKSAAVLGKAADAKHVQMYFLDPKAQAAAEALGWSGKVAPPAGTTDMVAVSNAMNKAGKANIAMHKSIAYDVALTPQGSAETTLSLWYANDGPFPYPTVPSDFRDWLRVYRLPGTVFPPTRPDGSTTTTTTEFGFPAETRMFMLSRGQSTTQVFSAMVPEAVREGSGGSAGSGGATGGAGTYRLYLVRQADLEDVPTTVTVTPPSGRRIEHATARFVASGATVPVRVEQGRAVAALPLAGDLVLDVRIASP